MRDIVDDIEARDVLLAQQERRMRLLFAEDGDEHIGHAHFLATAGLHMEHSPLQHPLEPQRRLHFALVIFG